MKTRYRVHYNQSGIERNVKEPALRKKKNREGKIAIKNKMAINNNLTCNLR